MPDLSVERNKKLAWIGKVVGHISQDTTVEASRKHDHQTPQFDALLNCCIAALDWTGASHESNVLSVNR
jgi:hypothetical protein